MKRREGRRDGKGGEVRSFQGGDVFESGGSRIEAWEMGFFWRRLHSSLHFSAASENNASPTQSAEHYSSLPRPFSTTVLDSRSQFCDDPSRQTALHEPPPFFLPFRFSPLLHNEVSRPVHQTYYFLKFFQPKSRF